METIVPHDLDSAIAGLEWNTKDMTKVSYSEVVEEFNSRAYKALSEIVNDIKEEYNFDLMKLARARSYYAGMRSGHVAMAMCMADRQPLTGYPPRWWGDQIHESWSELVKDVKQTE